MSTISIVESTRPDDLDSIIGMEANKRRIYYDIRGCQENKTPLPHYIISGPPGTGKSTIANIISKLTKGDVYKFIGSDLDKPSVIIDLASKAHNGDVIFVEEAQSIPKKCQAILLEWLENYQVLIGNISKAPKVCFVFPTTNPGKLSTALRTRCRKLDTSYYSTEEIELIIKAAAGKIGLDVTKSPKAVTKLALSSRGTPRVAVLHRLDPLRNVMAVDKLTFTERTIDKFFDAYNINPYGLEGNDMTYCNTLYEKLHAAGGKPIGKNIIVQSTGLSSDDVDNVIEPYLQQMEIIQVVPKGRIFTDFGYKVLNRKPVEVIATQVQRQINARERISNEELIKLLKDPAVRRQGMRAVAKHFGLIYPSDNQFIKSKLEEVGYTSRQRAGIVPLK